MSVTRVLIADDHPILCAGLRLLLNSQADMTVVADVVNWPSAIAEAGRLRPDVITLDLSMPGGDPFEGVREIRRTCDKALIVVLTMHSHVDYFRAAVAAGRSRIRSQDIGRRRIALCNPHRPVGAVLRVPVPEGRNGKDVAPPVTGGCREVRVGNTERPGTDGPPTGRAGADNREVADQVRLSVKTDRIVPRG